MIFSAVLTTLLTFLQSEALKFPLHMEVQLVRLLSMVLLNVVRMGGGSRALHILHRKCRCCCTFLTSATLFTDQVRLSGMCTTRNLVLVTTSTAVSLMSSGARLVCFVLKSTMSSLVLSAFRIKLFLLHQPTSCSTSSLSARSWSFLMRPTTVSQ